MALSPTDAQHQRQAKREAALATLEDLIDGFLRDFLDGDQCVVDVDNTVASGIFDVTVSKYRNIGWLVDVRSDFKANRQLVFAVPPA